MTSKFKWIIGVALAALVAAASAPLGFWSDRLRGELAEQVGRTIGLDVGADGKVTIALLPWPRATFRNVRVGREEDAAFLTAEAVRADILIAPLLAGKLEFAGFHLTRPTIVVDADGLAPESPTAIKRAGAAPSASGEARRADRARLGNIRVTEGVLRVRSRATGYLLVDSINCDLYWPNLGAPATLAGHGGWRGQRFDVEALVSRPAEVLRGEKTPFTLKLSSRPLDLALNGSINGGARWLVEARLASTSERLPQLLSVLDIHPPMPGRLARFSASGQLRALPQNATISDLKLTIDNNSFDGSLSLRTNDKRPLVSGTLAARTLELKSSEFGLPALRTRDREWSRESLDATRLGLFDADLRVSAGRVTLGRFAMTEAGFLVTSKQGRLELTTAGADAYGGTVRGGLIFDSRHPTPEVRLNGTFRNIQLGDVFRDAGRAQRFTGVASGEITLGSLGSNMHAIMQQASGAVKLSVRNGEIQGLDLEKALRRTEKRPLSIPTEVRSGSTRFLAAEIDARVQTGVLRLERAQATGHGVEMRVSGDADLAERTVRLAIAARQPRPANAPAGSREPPTLVLDVAGFWDNPGLSIDPESLMTHSEAAAPLLRRSAPAATTAGDGAPPAATPAAATAR